MASFLSIAQGFKIAAGLMQVGFALWVVMRSPRTRTNVAFTVAFGANGIAYAIWNLARPGFRTPHSFALEGRGVLNWIAALAMVLFAVFFLRMLQHSRTRLVFLPVSIVLAMLATDIMEARAYHLDVIAFGGLALDLATAFALALFALIFTTVPLGQIRSQCALFSAALAINLTDHIGAGIIRPGPYSVIDVVVHLAAMLIILGLWFWNSRAPGAESSRMSLIVILGMIAPFLAGVLVRIELGSYRAVQESGFIGAGRIAATALLIYAMLARRLFSLQDEREGATASAGGN